MNATRSLDRSTLLRTVALAAMLGAAAVGIARGAAERTLKQTASVAGTQRVVFDCSTANVSCEIIAVGASTARVEITAHVSGPDAANVEILRKPGRAHFAVVLKDQPKGRGSIWSSVRNAFRPSSWSRPNAFVKVELRVPNGNELDLFNTDDGIQVRGVHARLSLSDVNGSISARGSANVHASTVNGSLDLTLPAAAPEVSANSVNGSIAISFAGAFTGHVSASTVNGRVTNPFGDGDGPGRVSLSTVNGSITLQHG